MVKLVRDRRTSISFQRLAARLFRRSGRKQGLSFDGHTLIPKPKKLGEHFVGWCSWQTCQFGVVQTKLGVNSLLRDESERTHKPTFIATQPSSGACEPEWLCTCNALHTRQARHKTVGLFCWCGGVRTCRASLWTNGMSASPHWVSLGNVPRWSRRIGFDSQHRHSFYPRSNYRDGVPLEHTCDGGLFLNEQDRSYRNRLHFARHPEAIQAKGYYIRTPKGFGTKETDPNRCTTREHPIHQIPCTNPLRLRDISNRNMSGCPSGQSADTVRGDIPTHRPREMENDCPLTADKRKRSERLEIRSSGVERKAWPCSPQGRTHHGITDPKGCRNFGNIGELNSVGVRETTARQHSEDNGFPFLSHFRSDNSL